LPDPFTVGVGIFAFQGIGKVNRPKSFFQIIPSTAARFRKGIAPSAGESLSDRPGHVELRFQKEPLEYFWRFSHGCFEWGRSILLQNVTVEKDQGAESLVLRGNSITNTVK